jgi:hypothetical protein
MLSRFVLAAVFAALAVASGFASGNKVSSVVHDEATITIRVPVAIVGADAALVRRWEQAIDRLWNRGNDGRAFTVCGRDVRVDAQWVLHGLAPQPQSSHLVIVQAVKPGQNYVSTVWHSLGTSPSYSPRTGYWGSHIDDGTAAHEFGHLLGLLDEYVETDANANGSRAPGERPMPDVGRHPDAPFSLMAADRGAVLLRHVREALRIHGAERLMACLDDERRTKN